MDFDLFKTDEKTFKRFEVVNTWRDGYEQNIANEHRAGGYLIHLRNAINDYHFVAVSLVRFNIFWECLYGRHWENRNANGIFISSFLPVASCSLLQVSINDAGFYTLLDKICRKVPRNCGLADTTLQICYRNDHKLIPLGQ